MTAEQLDMLADLEQEQADAVEDALRRAGDFSWVRDLLTTGKGGRSCCAFCRREGRWDHVKTGCSGDWRRAHGQRCSAQRIRGNGIRYYARGLRDRDPVVTDPSALGKVPFDEARCRQMLDERIERAHAAQVDVDAILAEVAQEAVS